MNEKLIIENYNKLLDLVDSIEEVELRSSLKSLYERYADRISTAPASSKVEYHHCFIGGLACFILKHFEVAESIVSTIPQDKLDFTRDELISAVLVASIGKIGTDKYEFYSQVADAWKLKRGIQYDVHDKHRGKSSKDLSIYLIVANKIPISEKVYYTTAFSLNERSDQIEGLYSKNTSLLPIIINFASVLAARLENSSDNLSSAKRAENSGATKLQTVLNKSNSHKAAFDISSIFEE